MCIALCTISVKAAACGWVKVQCVGNSCTLFDLMHLSCTSADLVLESVCCFIAVDNVVKHLF